LFEPRNYFTPCAREKCRSFKPCADAALRPQKPLKELSAALPRKRPAANIWRDMATTNSLFYKTAAGHDACGLPGSRLPQDYLTILDAVLYATRFSAIRARLPHCSPAKILGYLEDLEAIGLMESVPVDWLRALYALGNYQLQPLAHQH
jgi:hypothetical protein